MKEGFTTVILKDDLADALKESIKKEYADSRKPRPELSTYVQSLLWDVVDGKLAKVDA